MAELLAWSNSIALVIGTGSVLLLAVYFWPNRGLRNLLLRNRDHLRRVACEDALKHIHNEQLNGQSASIPSVAGTLEISIGEAADLLGDMEKRNLVTFQNGALRLTSEGRRYALHIIRAHRLWERYLAEETGFGEGEWHQRAEQFEHVLTPAQADELSLKLNHPSHDPHGDPIPTADGRIDTNAGQPMTTLSEDSLGRILHLEDEPPSIYAQLTALGLQPGLEVRILEKSPDHVRFWANGDEQVLATLLANSITVAPITAAPTIRQPRTVWLNQLKIGCRARVLELSPACRGADRRRLLDLGFVPGADVEAEISSPTGDPVAYRVRGTLIALRHEQAGLIRIVPGESALAA